MEQSLNFLNNNESMKILLDIQLELKELSVEQKHIKKDVANLAAIRAKDAEKIKTMTDEIHKIGGTVKAITTELENKKESKKESKNNLIQWVTVLCGVATLVAYLTYEVGLHKPQPHQGQQAQKIQLQQTANNNAKLQVLSNSTT